ncbi:biotin-dependent carboxyltransferase family protein [Mucilaginibacter sp. KACC 22063]|uniref:5-oxoprolinase subunit C family protein n=1 Tax=Mucilaginibacter sp. KACC 22063 TaxID=3025666 RepID=UPI002366F566|nr:biotin-dependent carboxyltransferase family protein [Mucilaginibacter sp. KACC 22063]WDF56761.1 biotin-dependent carboxyltransferase family protein [Mucilaginibacter sp. KACC 22063]
MQIEIVKAGLLSTIQDLGRQAHRWQAVPVSGAMDVLSARLANKALGNNDNDAVIEFTYAGASFKALTDILIAYCGDSAILTVNDQVIKADRAVFIPAGTLINLDNNNQGVRTYLAIAGGWDVPDVLNSKSTYITAAIGGLDGRSLKNGDVLTANKDLNKATAKIYDALSGGQIKYLEWKVNRSMFIQEGTKDVRVVPAQEFTWFNSDSLLGFLSKPYQLSQQSNRMGYRLDGWKLNRRTTGELLSTAVSPGTLQVSHDGSLMLLMADCQTTGGYPRIAQVAAVDLPICAQLKPGDAICFHEISRQEAERLYIEREEQLTQLSVAIQNKYL